MGLSWRAPAVKRSYACRRAHTRADSVISYGTVEAEAEAPMIATTDILTVFLLVIILIIVFAILLKLK